MRWLTCLILLALMVSGQTVSASETASVPPLINYQGRLVGDDGQPLPTADYTISVSIYDAAIGGNLVWGPQVFDGATGVGHGARVPVVKGYFNLIIGPVDVQGRALSDAFLSPNRFFEVTVDAAAINPRQQVLSAPYAITAGNIPVPPVEVPQGIIAMWSGNIEDIPEGWVLCNGENGTPDLRDQFIVGAGSEHLVADTGGEKMHQLTVEEIPQMRFVGAAMTGNGTRLEICGAGCFGFPFVQLGADAPHENRPPYYALAFIMRL